MTIKLSINKLLLSLFTLLLFSCSPERNNPISRGFHNIAAHYNAYWIAKGRLNKVEDAIQNQHEDNYNDILSVFSEFDTTFTKTLETDLDDCFKKASLAVQRHPNSHWIYPSYILIGKSYYYKEKHAEAIKVFKYVNQKSEDNNYRHEALVALMQTFLKYEEKNNAIAVSDFLRKESLNKTNLRSLYLTRAFMYQMDKNYDKMVQNLVLAVPLVSNKKKQARIYFIIGQIYQKIGFEAQAYDNYQQCLKNNPEYELYFYSRLNMAQVSDLSKQSDVRKIRKYFVKLLNDSKNEEFQDKIYYEMGEFELKQLDYPKAIRYFQLSAQVSTSNRRQKAYSFLKLGQIHYDELKKYELAKAYYDSTISVLPQDEEDYESIKKRQEILDDFVQQLHTIQEQDSLLNLVKMDSIALNEYVDAAIVALEARDAAQAISANKKSKKTQGLIGAQSISSRNSFTENISGEESVWYFYNSASIRVGESEFKRIWGGRPLEDNWRRSLKQPQILNGSNSAKDDQKQPESDEDLVSNEKSKYDKKSMLSAIPFSAEAQLKAQSKIEDAYYKLGNIYNFNLIEKENAIISFRTLLNRFPDSDYEPEVLYQLYLIFLERENEENIYYRNKLIEDFPKSNFAKVIVNPNYMEENNAASEQAQVYYKQAYEYFKLGDFVASNFTIDKAIEELPENDFTDNLMLLQILMIAPTENIYNYQFALSKFINDYPKSDVVEYANELLTVSQNFVKQAVEKKGTEFIDFFEQAHYFVLLYKTNEFEEHINTEIQNFIDKSNSSTELKKATLIFNETHSMILIDKFPNQEDAEKFYAKFNKSNSLIKNIDSENFNNFVISRDNFQIFYQTKDITTYLSFFEKHYL